MKAAALTLLALLVLATTSHGGPNAGGRILLAWNGSIPYTKDPEYFEAKLAAVGEATVAQAPAATVLPDPPASQRGIWYAYAAFPPGSSPRLKGIQFGVDYRLFSDGAGVRIDWVAAPPGSTEIRTTSPEWPLPKSGIAMVFRNTMTDRIDQVYVFAGYGTPSQLFKLTWHPAQDPAFADDATPSNVDRIAGFGTLGFGASGIDTRHR